MNLNEFTKVIECEIYGAHELSADTIVKVIELVESNPVSTPTHHVESNLTPFDKALLATIAASLDDLKPSLREKILTNITTIGSTIFPENVNIYLAYALVNIKRDRKTYLTKVLDNSIKLYEFQEDIWLKLFIYFGTLLLIVGAIILINNARHPAPTLPSIPI